jgi:serine protease Do
MLQHTPQHALGSKDIFMDRVLELNVESAGVIDEAYKSLVQVRNGKRGAGAGTIWHPQGLVVTNAHVAGRGPLKVELADGRVFDAEILSRDSDCDLAALRIQAEGLPTAQLADSRAVRPGQYVMALGHPWGIVGAATAGVLIGMGRQWPEMPPTRQDWLVVSLHLRPGHSGGPLVDARGRFLGINTMINGPDVGFVIPSHVIVEFLKRTLL